MLANSQLNRDRFDLRAEAIEETLSQGSAALVTSLMESGNPNFANALLHRTRRRVIRIATNFQKTKILADSD